MFDHVFANDVFRTDVTLPFRKIAIVHDMVSERRNGSDPQTSLFFKQTCHSQPRYISQDSRVVERRTSHVVTTHVDTVSTHDLAAIGLFRNGRHGFTFETDVNVIDRFFDERDAAIDANVCQCVHRVEHVFHLKGHAFKEK